MGEEYFVASRFRIIIGYIVDVWTPLSHWRKRFDTKESAEAYAWGRRRNGDLVSVIAISG